MASPSTPLYSDSYDRPTNAHKCTNKIVIKCFQMCAFLVWLPLWSLYRQPLVKITPPEPPRTPQNTSQKIPPVPVLRHSCQSQAIFLVEQWFIMMFLNWFNKWNQTRSFHAESLYSFNWLGSEELRVLVQILEIFVLANKTHLINLTHSRLSSDWSCQYAISENSRKLIVISFANIICSQSGLNAFLSHNFTFALNSQN